MPSATVLFVTEKGMLKYQLMFLLVLLIYKLQYTLGEWGIIGTLGDLH